MALRHNNNGRKNLKKALESDGNSQTAPWQSTFQERNDLTKYGSNAIGLFALALKFGLEDLDTVAADAIVDGGNDKKLDLVYVDEEKRFAVVIQAYTAQKPKPLYNFIMQNSHTSTCATRSAQTRRKATGVWFISALAKYSLHAFALM